MTHLAFGTDAKQLGRNEFCCAPNCEAASVLAGPDLPLCENHLKVAYRRIGDYLRTKEEHPDNAKPSAWERFREQQYQPMGLPFGVCPKCEWATLASSLDTGAVKCMRAAECGYNVTKEQFKALLNVRIAERLATDQVVYYIRFGDRIKIGTTRSLISRMNALPHDEFLVTEPGGVHVERQRHKQFAHLRAEVGTSREWFQMAPELLEHIAALKARQVA